MMKRSGLIRQKYMSALLLSLPALVGLVLFQYWPIFKMVQLSFLNYKIFTGEFTWKGIENYVTAMQDPLLLHTFKVTGIYFLLKVPLQMALGLGLAMLVKNATRGIGWVRTIILLPVVTSMVVVSTVWGIMFNSDSGMVNGILALFGVPAQIFLSGTAQALPTIAFITIWKDVGLTMLFFMAGLLSIPHVYYEAAEVDGANAWQRFRYITLPLLKPTTVFVVVTTTIEAFKVFVPVKVLTDGGPSNATRVILLYIFELAFHFNRLGYAATISVLLAALLLLLSLLQMRLTREERDAKSK